MKSSIIGLIVSTFIIYFALINAIPNLLFLINIIGLLIVLGGTLSASIITFGLKDLISIFRICLKVFFIPRSDMMVTLNNILDLSKKDQLNGNSFAHTKDDSFHPFLNDGLRLIENDLTEDQIEKILSDDLEKRIDRQMQQVGILKTLSKYPPAFGMIGTVIGLIGLMSKMNATDDGSGNMVGPSMAIALLTTLYGLLFANYLFIPMADNLLNRLNYEVQVRKLIIEGVLLLKKSEDPVYIKESLSVYLDPRNRSKVNSVL